MAEGNGWTIREYRSPLIERWREDHTPDSASVAVGEELVRQAREELDDAFPRDGLTR